MASREETEGDGKREGEIQPLVATGASRFTSTVESRVIRKKRCLKMGSGDGCAPGSRPL